MVFHTNRHIKTHLDQKLESMIKLQTFPYRGCQITSPPP
eukprot:UN08203